MKTTVEFLNAANRPFNANNLIDEMAPKCGVKKSVVLKSLLVRVTAPAHTAVACPAFGSYALDCSVLQPKS